MAREKEDQHITTSQLEANGNEMALSSDTSPGVKRMEAISRHLDLPTRIILFVGIFIVAYVYSLDITLRYAFQPTATDSFKTHSLLATVQVLRSVIASAAQPTAAKIADVVGRVELLLVSVIFYIVGTIVDATSHGVKAFAAGAVLYQIGYTCVALLVEVIVADTTSLRSRLLFSYIPVSPFLINAWVSGDVAAATLSNIGWRWGIGMWGIIYPVSIVPLVFALWWAHRKAKANGELANFRTPYQLLGARKLPVQLFWQLDVIGILLIIAILALILVPLTLAGGIEATWRQAHILAPLIIGILCIPAFAVWESRASHPAVPFHLLKDRTVWAGLGIILTMNSAASCQGDYLYTVLIISFNESVLSATRIVNLYSFSSCVTGIAVGFVVLKVRRLKPFILFGTCLHLVAYGVLIKYRGGLGANHAGMVGAQILMGIAVGFFTYAALASVQSATRHEHVAVITGLYFCCFSVGGAVGNAISGAIWTQILPNQLQQALSGLTNSATLAEDIYAAPFTAIEDYPWGTPVRDGIVEAYRYTQKLLCITGICIAVLCLLFALVLRDIRLTSQQSREEVEDEAVTAKRAASEF